MRTELTEASELLRRAVGEVDDPEVGDRIGDQADQLAELAERERGPDHGRLDRHQQVLRDVKSAAGVDEDAAALIDEANELILEYRKTVEGV